jgi:hypothetical protein
MNLTSLHPAPRTIGSDPNGDFMYLKSYLDVPAYLDVLRRCKGPVAYFFSWLNAKLFGVPVPIIYRYPELPTVLDSNFGQLPASLGEKVNELLEDPFDPPLQPQFHYRAHFGGMPQANCGAVFLSADGLACVCLVHSPEGWPRTTVACFSWLVDGGILVTTDEPDWHLWICKQSGIHVEGVHHGSLYADDVVMQHYIRLRPISDRLEVVSPVSVKPFLVGIIRAINDSWMAR